MDLIWAGKMKRSSQITERIFSSGEDLEVRTCNLLEIRADQIYSSDSPQLITPIHVAVPERLPPLGLEPRT